MAKTQKRTTKASGGQTRTKQEPEQPVDPRDAIRQARHEQREELRKRQGIV